MNKLIIAFCVLAFFFALIEGMVTGDSAYATTQLTTAIASDETNFTMYVVNTDGFRDAGYVTIDNEILTYNGKTDTTFTYCNHAAQGTAPSYHAAGTKVYSEATGAVNAALGFQVVGTDSNLNIMSFGWDFVTTTVPKLISFDYIFLDSGPLQYVRAFLLLISVGFIFMLCYMLISAFGGLLQNIFRGVP